MTDNQLKLDTWKTLGEIDITNDHPFNDYRRKTVLAIFGNDDLGPESDQLKAIDALLRARTALIESGDTPAIWTSRVPFSVEIREIFGILRETRSASQAAKLLLAAIKRAKQAQAFRSEYPKVAASLKLIAKHTNPHKVESIFERQFKAA